MHDVAGEPHAPRPVRRSTLIGACAFVVVLVVAMEVRHDRDEARSPEPPISARSPEARLAALEPAPTRLAGVRAVKRVGTFLDILEAECPANSRRELAALAFRGVQELRARGIASTPTDVFNGVMRLDDVGRGARCGSYFDRSVASVTQGRR